MVNVWTPYRNRLYVGVDLRLKFTRIDPNIEQLCQNWQAYCPH